MVKWLPLLLCLTFPIWLCAETDEEAAKRICARFADYHPGPDATPTEEDRKLVASKALVGSIVELLSTRKEYDEFRRYCLVTGDCNRELAMIFANGWGVTRDYDAATYFLCRAEDIAPAEQWGMLAHIETMRTSEQPEELLYCPHVTSGMGQAYCARLENENRATEWDDRMAMVKKGLSEEAASKLGPLLEAADLFAQKEGGLRGLVENGNGTGLPAMVLSEQTRLQESGVAAIERLTGSRAAGSTDDDLKRADAEMNDAYHAAMTTPWDLPGFSDADDVGKEALRDAQRAWIKYRDAWTAYYLARWKGKAGPEELRREIVTALTLERTEQLKSSHRSELWEEEEL
jgi:uncharacterized protein YecT (DUF1311 family)